MGKKFFVYSFFPLLLCTILMACRNKTKRAEQDKDLFELISYPAWLDTVDCSRVGLIYKPYPCLGLHKKTVQEIDSLYGKKSLYISVDTLYHGWEKDDEFYTFDDKDFTIAKMLYNVPVAKVMYTSRNVMGYILYLYFIEYNKQDVVFYGLHVSPHVMLE